MLVKQRCVLVLVELLINKNYLEEFKDELKVEEWNDVVISQEFQGLKLMYNVSHSSFQMYYKLRTKED